MPHMRFDDLLGELQGQLDTIRSIRDRMHALLDAVLAIGSDLDLQTVLRSVPHNLSQGVSIKGAGVGFDSSLSIDRTGWSGDGSPASGSASSPSTSTGIEGSASRTGSPRSLSKARTFPNTEPQIK